MTLTAPTETTVRELRNYIGGRWVPATTTQRLDVTDPATGGVLARVPLSGAQDVAAAAVAARAALPGWRGTSVIRRAALLFSLRQALVDRAEELARTVTAEMGKTLPDARAEVGRMIEMVEAATAVPQTTQGRNLEGIATNVDIETIRQPVGVCAAITPFNFPAMVPMWFLPFAIGCGNTFILKPSEQDPLTQTIVFEILEQIGVPPGVVNLVHGGADVVNGICDSPDIDAVSFVGSARVAKHVYTRAAATGKRVQALGGA
ncbi:aldehyde dehydrogenase family protein, partial [Paraconexibacter sp.]|uniref:aldehyde dehydrogenase family protein n=1 Tax=Paraconexibacter sp. TaxID=2949640 RepID=UPI0035669C8A